MKTEHTADVAATNTCVTEGAAKFTWETETHAPELYTVTAIASKVHGFGGVDDAMIARYEERGYLAIDDGFSAEQVEGARQGLFDLVAGKRADFKDIEFEAHARTKLATLPPEERQDYVRKLMSFTAYDGRLRAMEEDPRLLGIIRRILHAEPMVFQEMALLKPPHGREKPWHQDNAYFDIPLDTPVVGVWIALDEVTVENGCMHLLPGGHKGGPRHHFQRRDWQLCDRDMLSRPCTAVPLRPGGLLIFSGMLPHGTPRNTTTQRRRALQYHYVPAGTQKIAKEIRLGAYGSEGKDVTC